MQTEVLPYPGQDAIAALADRIKTFRRTLLWGEMGAGKSTLALQLLAELSRQGRKEWLLLELDPGTPPCGLPGTLSVGRMQKEQLVAEHILPLCTFNSSRFRLPLIMAARKLHTIARSSSTAAQLLIDPPGVIKGVGGAELLTGLLETLTADAVLVLSRDGTIPLAAELATFAMPIFVIEASSAARRPTKAEREKQRTRLWDGWLNQASEEVFDLEQLSCIGTPPPRTIPAAWLGRQLALFDRHGAAVAMGEIGDLSGTLLTARVARFTSGQPASLLVRDAGRNGAGHLATIIPSPAAGRIHHVPAEMSTTYLADDRNSPPLSSHLGNSWATLVGGVFGDPLLHVRLRNQKRSFLFDLGAPARLQAKIAHQVEAVFLSHSHLDHIGGFIWFLRCRLGPFGPCKIFGPEGTIARISHFLEAITWDRIADLGPVFLVAEIHSDKLVRARLQPGRNREALAALPVENGIVMTDTNLVIRAAICDHNIPSVAYALEFVQEISIRKERLRALGLASGPWLGYLKQCIGAKNWDNVITLPDGSRRPVRDLAAELAIITPGKKLVYGADMADTATNRNKIITLAHGAHTLFCEASFTRGDQDKADATQHLTTFGAAQIAKAAGVKNLVPFHFSKRYEFRPHVLYEEICAQVGDIRVIGAHSQSALERNTANDHGTRHGNASSPPPEP